MKSNINLLSALYTPTAEGHTWLLRYKIITMSHQVVAHFKFKKRARWCCMLVRTGRVNQMSKVEAIRPNHRTEGLGKAEENTVSVWIHHNFLSETFHIMQSHSISCECRILIMIHLSFRFVVTIWLDSKSNKISDCFCIKCSFLLYWHCENIIAPRQLHHPFCLKYKSSRSSCMRNCIYEIVENPHKYCSHARCVLLWLLPDELKLCLITAHMRFLSAQ